MPLDKRYSLQSWMKLSADADLTGGVGKIDEDEDQRDVEGVEDGGGASTSLASTTCGW